MTSTDTPAPPPDSVHASLERAVADGRALIEADSAFAPQAGVWHEPADDAHPRRVGAGGAVMAMTLGVGANESTTPADFAPRWRGVLRAIDRANALDWANAWDALHGSAGTARMPNPRRSFANRVEAALERPPRDTHRFVTKRSYEAWLRHIERDALARIAGIERDLVGEIAPARPPPAPETLAETVRLALTDGAALARDACNADARYTFYSGAWHGTAHDARGACVVCAAGSVMARTLQAPHDATLFPGCFAYAWTAVLEAVESVRIGDWRRAFTDMHGLRHRATVAFATAMARTLDDAGGATTPESGDFSNLAGYLAWLDHVRANVLPAVTTHEARALARRADER